MSRKSLVDILRTIEAHTAETQSLIAKMIKSLENQEKKKRSTHADRIQMAEDFHKSIIRMQKRKSV